MVGSIQVQFISWRGSTLTKLIRKWWSQDISSFFPWGPKCSIPLPGLAGSSRALGLHIPSILPSRCCPSVYLPWISAREVALAQSESRWSTYRTEQTSFWRVLINFLMSNFSSLMLTYPQSINVKMEKDKGNEGDRTLCRCHSAWSAPTFSLTHSWV